MWNIKEKVFLKHKMNMMIKKINKFKDDGDFEKFMKSNVFSWGSTLWLFVKYAIAWILLFIIYISIFGTVVGIISSFSGKDSQTGDLAVIFTGIIGFCGIVYAEIKKEKERKKDLKDNSIYIFSQYLIEIKRENYKHKIFKDDLSHMFMNLPTNVLYVLSDIQNNVKEILKNNTKSEDYKKMVEHEVVFLISYIRGRYGFVSFNRSEEEVHLNIIKEITDNSSSKKIQKTNKYDK